MAGYRYGQNAVFGSGNITSNMSGPTVVVGTDINFSSGSTVNRSLFIGNSLTINEDITDSLILGTGNTVESGTANSAIIGGRLNKMKAGSAGNVILGGLLGNASSTDEADYSVILGGMMNSQSGGDNGVVGGTMNVTQDLFEDGIVIGSGNNISSSQTQVFGDSNLLPNTSYRTFIGGGHFCNASATGKYVVMSGYYGYANIPLGRTHGGGKFGSVTGSAQFTDTIVGCQTTNATETKMVNQIPGIETSIAVRQDSSMMFRAEIVARRTGTQTESAAYEIVGCIKNDNGTTALQGTITKTVIAEADSNWDVTAVANNTDDTLDIKVTGAAGKNINWVAKVKLVETNGA